MKAKLTHKLAHEPWAIRPEYHSTLVAAAEAYHYDEEEDGGPYEPPTPEEVDGIAIIHIHGPLGKMLTDWELMFGMTDYDDVATQLAEADANPNVTAILLHIDSPGGTITGLPELAAKMRAVEKPLVAYTEGTAASAAYWIASQADNVLLSQSAEVGSVGVYIALLDQSEFLRNQGLRVNAIAAGENKLDYADFKPLSDEARERLQANVNKWHDRFKGDINIKRTVPGDSMTGQVYEGLEAVEAGLADGVVDDIQDVIALMTNL